MQQTGTKNGATTRLSRLAAGTASASCGGRFLDDSQWVQLAAEWSIRADTTYLNHGSFGPSPDRVRMARRRWIMRLDEQPMDFYVRQLEGHLEHARDSLARSVGTKMENLVFVDNATYGMNVVADSFPLQTDDEVLLSDHEYGAVNRIWDRACIRSGAQKKIVNLPAQIDSKQEVVDAIVSRVTDRTRLLVISHITSATALILPVKEICAAMAERGVPVCIDGPHAPMHVDLNVEEIGCDFYTSSCHKWLCGPLGSGFLYAVPHSHKFIRPAIKSWGRLLPALPERWDEEFTWMGTKDPSVFLTLPDAIEFMQGVGVSEFRGRSRSLANYAEKKLAAQFGTTPIGKRENGWYGSMAHVPLPAAGVVLASDMAEGDMPDSAAGHYSTLQLRLWEVFGIEIPIIDFAGRWFVRVSCHLYNSAAQIDYLSDALRILVRHDN